VFGIVQLSSDPIQQSIAVFRFVNGLRSAWKNSCRRQRLHAAAAIRLTYIYRDAGVGEPDSFDHRLASSSHRTLFEGPRVDQSIIDPRASGIGPGFRTEFRARD
jgi:hypothetical protein